MSKAYIPSPNSFKNTFCVFKEMPLLEIQDLKVDYISESGSQYFYTEKGMYRLSNHWGRLANSKWRLISEIESDSKIKLGYANWDEFYNDNKHEALYYLEVNFEDKTVLYQHKNNKEYNGKAILRTVDDTMKRVKQARNILSLTNWAQHFEEIDIEELRKKIITELIFTNKSLEEIKRNYYG